MKRWFLIAYVISTLFCGAEEIRRHRIMDMLDAGKVDEALAPGYHEIPSPIDVSPEIKISGLLVFGGEMKMIPTNLEISPFTHLKGDIDLEALLAMETSEKMRARLLTFDKSNADQKKTEKPVASADDIKKNYFFKYKRWVVFAMFQTSSPGMQKDEMVIRLLGI